MAGVEAVFEEAGPQKAAECQAALLYTVEQLLVEGCVGRARGATAAAGRGSD